jgi:hypothetical protein
MGLIKHDKKLAPTSTPHLFSASSKREQFAHLESGKLDNDICEQTEMKEEKPSSASQFFSLKPHSNHQHALELQGLHLKNDCQQLQRVEPITLVNHLSRKKAVESRLFTGNFGKVRFNVEKHCEPDILLNPQDAKKHISPQLQYQYYEEKEKETIDCSSEPFIIVETMTEPENDEDEYVFV